MNCTHSNFEEQENQSIFSIPKPVTPRKNQCPIFLITSFPVKKKAMKQ